jgi:hypothetical protein
MTREVPSLRTRKKGLQHEPSNDSESEDGEAIWAQRRARHARNNQNETRYNQTEVWFCLEVSFVAIISLTDLDDQPNADYHQSQL